MCFKINTSSPFWSVRLRRTLTDMRQAFFARRFGNVLFFLLFTWSRIHFWHCVVFFSWHLPLWTEGPTTEKGWCYFYCRGLICTNTVHFAGTPIRLSKKQVQGSKAWHLFCSLFLNMQIKTWAFLFCISFLNAGLILILLLLLRLIAELSTSMDQFFALFHSKRRF